MTQVYAVEYKGMDWNIYFSGGWNFRTTMMKFFSTEEKAQAFINNPYDEYVPTWKKSVTVKEAGEGKLKIFDVE